MKREVDRRRKIGRGDAFAKIENFFIQYDCCETFLSIGELAKTIDVSESSIVRYCQKKGYKGYKDFTLAMANTKGIRTGSGFGVDLPVDRIDDTSLLQFVKNVFLINCDVILKTLETLNLDEFDGVIKKIKAARSIFVIGYGNSAPIATDVCLRLSRLGFNVSSATDPYADALKINNLNEQDLLVAVSYSGSSSSLVRGIQLAKNGKVPCILITSTPDSVASGFCDNVLVAAQSNINDESISTRTAQLSLLDAIFANLIHSDSLASYEAHVKRVDKYLLGMHLYLGGFYEKDSFVDYSGNDKLSNGNFRQWRG